MSEITLTFSISRIIESVCALSAMRSYVRHHRELLPVVTTDNADALRLIAGNAWCALLTRLAPRVAGCTMPPDPDDSALQEVDLLTLRLRTSDSFNTALQPALVKAAELFIVRAALVELFDGPDPAESERQQSLAEEAADRFVEMLDNFPPGLRITPCGF